jgi:hypothetical protein
VKKGLLALLFTIALTACAVKAPEHSAVKAPVQAANNDMVEPVTLNEPKITPPKKDAPLPVEDTVLEDTVLEDTVLEDTVLEEMEEASITTPEPAPSPNTSDPGEEQVPAKEEQSAPTENEPDLTGWILYETDNLELLARNILEGNVVYYNGQYWCSPEYYELILNEEIVYYNDVSEDDNTSPGRTNILTPDVEVIIVD